MKSTKVLTIEKNQTLCTSFFSGGPNDMQFPRPRDLDLIQSTPLEALSLKTPPRVLTLNERPLDFLEEDQRATPDSEEVVSDEAIHWLL